MDDMDDIMEEDVRAEDEFGGGNQHGATSEIHESWNGGTKEGEDDHMAILPYVAPLREPLLSPSQPLLLFGTEILMSNVWQWVFIDQDSPPQNSKSVWRLGN
ncbi:hypothetical protein D8674_026176 [Pyrus ussuriensis x Pyrus communis]|uniref:Uncharacterized protein n=1 Tax=Pyrus ussuriensis x Pyrus communis TaxID=2448454 RepID=A0A5N5IAY6_9ROSA|nr:hypothetical protein D8674_026176 [Pyrus ussuriensis x Pyrus communis]